MLKYVDRKYFGHNLCRQKMPQTKNYNKVYGQKNISDIIYVGRKCLRHKLCQNAWTEKCLGHVLSRQKMSQT